MKKAIPVLVFFCYCVILCHAQVVKTDSLVKVIEISNEDSAKVNSLNELAKEYRNNNPDTAVFFANEALSLATKLNYKLGIAVAYNVISDGLMVLGEYEAAMKNSDEALEIIDEMLDSKDHEDRSKILQLEGNVYNGIGIINLLQGELTEGMKNFSASLKIYQDIGDKKASARPILYIGRIYYMQENYTEALKNFMTSYKIYEEFGDKKGIANTHNMIGGIYTDLGNSQEALKNYFAALAINKELNNQRDLAANLTNIGMVYYDMGNYTESLKNQTEALSIARKIENKAIMANCFNEIGNINKMLGDYKEALKNHFAALQIAEELGDLDQMINSYIDIGKVYTRLKQYDESSAYLNKGLSLARENHAILLLKEIYMNLATLDSSRGDFKRSLENYKMFAVYRDSIINKENSRNTLQIQMQYEYDKKEGLAKHEQEEKDALALKELQRQKLIRNFALGTIGLVLVLFLFIYRSYQARQALRLNDIRNRIASDLHDDIGSTLNSISIYSEVAKKKDEDYNEALEMIGDASRKIIDSMSDIVWTINAENDSFEKIIFRMKSLAYNLLRAKKIEFTFHADETLNDKKLSLEERRNFYLIFKEAVNNLVKYSSANRAAITLTNENNRIRLLIQDNGIGFDTSQETAGNGLKNMKRRANEMKAGFKIESQTGSGTQIELILKS